MTERVLNDELIFLILSIVSEIPKGKVATYGQIASLSGRDNNSRLVGKVLSMSEFFGEYPCHRVVNYKGRIAPNFKSQRSLLQDEGVGFKDEIHVNLKRYKWNI